jgi:hypothetical protein
MIELFRSSIFLLHTCRDRISRGVDRSSLEMIRSAHRGQLSRNLDRTRRPVVRRYFPLVDPPSRGVRQDPCRGTVVSLSLDPGCAQHPRWDDAADRDGTVTGVRCARRAPFRGRRCSWSLDVTSSSYARLFLPRRRVLRTRRSPVPVAHRRLLPGRCVRRARARVPTALLRLPSLVTPASARRYDPLTEETSRG